MAWKQTKHPERKRVTQNVLDDAVMEAVEKGRQVRFRGGSLLKNFGNIRVEFLDWGNRTSQLSYDNASSRLRPHSAVRLSIY